jgi:hypothetical protein
MTFSKARDLYTQCCIFACNTVLLAVAINAACAVGIWIKPFGAIPANPMAAYGKVRILKAYPGKAEAEVVALLHETWDEMTPKTAYEVLAGFKEAPFRGQFVNVDRFGFRRTEPQESWPPDPAKLNIFVFGGSTVFGYGVSDRETLASALQAELRGLTGKRVAVYNFGRASYFSTQELMLYYWLLTSGHVPALAIFVDGLNDFSRLNGQLDNTAYLSSLIQDENSGYGATLLRLFRRTATGRAIAWLERKIRKPSDTGRLQGNDTAVLSGVIDRWILNRHLIETLSLQFGSKAVFVWQPVPTYHYDFQHYHILGDLGLNTEPWGTSCANGYPLMAKARQQLEQNDNFLWLADIQENSHKNLYVDHVHYTADFMRDIAGHISNFLMANGSLLHQGSFEKR